MPTWPDRISRRSILGVGGALVLVGRITRLVGAAPADAQPAAIRRDGDPVSVFPSYVPLPDHTDTANDAIGYQFTPDEPLTVTSLGRIGALMGLQNEHRVELWRTSDMSLLAWVTVGPLSTLRWQGTNAGFYYTDLPQPLDLAAGMPYRVVSAEQSDAGSAWVDPWPDLAPLPSSDGAVTADGAVRGATGSAPALVDGTTGQGYGAPAIVYLPSGAVNLARTLPPRVAVRTSTSRQGYPSFANGYGPGSGFLRYPWLRLGFPWNRASLVNGNRHSTAEDMGWSSDGDITRDHREWVRLDLGAPGRISVVDLYPRDDAGHVGDWFPGAFTISTSVDGQQWSAQVARRDYPRPGAGRQRFTFAPTPARYVLIDCTSLDQSPDETGTPAYRAAFTQIEVYGNADSEPVAPPMPRSVHTGDLVYGLSFYPGRYMSGWTYVNASSRLSFDTSGAASAITVSSTNSPEPVILQHEFVLQDDGRVITEFRLRIDQPEPSARIGLADGDSTLVMLRIADGMLTVDTGTGSAQAVARLAQGVVYGIRLISDLTAGTISLQLNGATRVTDLRIQGQRPRADRIRVEVDGGRGDAAISLSPLHVYRGYLLYDSFTSARGGTVPDDWTVTQGTERVTTADTLSALPTESWALQIAPGDAPVAVQHPLAAVAADLKLHAEWAWLPSSEGGDQIGLVTTQGDVVEVVAQDGAFVLCVTGAPPQTLHRFRPDVWYRIELVVDRRRSRLDVLVNGKYKVTALPIAGYDEFGMFQIQSPTRGGTPTDISDIKVYAALPMPQDYVPEPKQISTAPYLVGLQSYSAWREGAIGGYDYIHNDADRQPVIGWFDQGSPEVSDWQIKQLVEHGVSFLQVLWYGPALGPQLTRYAPFRRTLFTSESLDDGHFRSRYGGKLKFAITFYNSPGQSWFGGTQADASPDVKTEAFQRYVLPYWLEWYLTDPRYLVIDGKPVISIYDPYAWRADFGDGAAAVLASIREQCVAAGFAGATLLGQCLLDTAADWTEQKLAGYQTIKDLGFDYAYSYIAGLPEFDQQRLAVTRGIGLDLIASPSVNWAPEPWYGVPGSQDGYFRPGPEWQTQLTQTRDTFLAAQEPTSLSRCMILIDNWDELGEGHFVMPTVGLGHRYLDGIRATFTADPPHVDVSPTPTQRARLDTLYPHGWRSDDEPMPQP